MHVFFNAIFYLFRKKQKQGGIQIGEDLYMRNMWINNSDQGDVDWKNARRKKRIFSACSCGMFPFTSFFSMDRLGK